MKRILRAIFRFLASPILIKELRATFRKWLFFWIFTGTLSITTIIILIVAFSKYSFGIGRISADEIGQQIFLWLTGTQTVLLYVLLPGFCATFISGERAAQSFDILVTSRLQPWEIIWGKTLTAAAYIGTFLFATLPLASMCFLYGGVTPWEILDSYWSLFASGMLIAVISICVSGLFSSAVWSVIVNYLVVLLLSIFYGGPAVWSFMFNLFRIGPWYMRISGAGIPVEYVILMWLIYTAVLVPFFIGAVNRVKPFSANRSTALRVYSVSVIVVLLLFLTGLGLFTPSSSNKVYGLALTAMGVMACIFVPLYLMLYPVEHNRQSPRILHKMYHKPWPVRLFFPGGLSGMKFTILSVIFWIGLAAFVGIIAGNSNERQQTLIIAMASYVAAFLISYALIGFWLSTTKLAQWAARVILAVILVANIALPMLAALITNIDARYSDFWASPLPYLSPIGAIYALESLARSSASGWIAVPIGFHLTLIFIFGALAAGRASQIRNAHMAAMAGAPMPDAFPATISLFSGRVETPGSPGGSPGSSI